MKNAIGGDIVKVGYYELLRLASPEIEHLIMAGCTRKGADGYAVFRVEQMDSSAYGKISFMLFGPGCTYKTIDEVAGRHLGQTPSQFAYPFAYWSKS